MSTENQLEQRKQIPLSWFVAFEAFGSKEEPKTIDRVIFSEDFVKQFEYTIDENKGSNYYRNYAHNMGSFENPSEIKNESVRKLVEEAEIKIKEITGFSVKEIIAKKDELEKLYKGKKEAPIRLNFS
jgi:uncharacterized Fe-S cluster-containing MiaB family protein